MQDYEKEFCKGVVNDTSADEEVIDIFSELLDTDDKVYFIKSNLNHSDIDHIDMLINAINGDLVELLELFGADYDDLNSIETTRDKWEDSEYAGDIETRIEELQEEDEDEDW